MCCIHGNPLWAHHWTKININKKNLSRGSSRVRGNKTFDAEVRLWLEGTEPRKPFCWTPPQPTHTHTHSQRYARNSKWEAMNKSWFTTLNTTCRDNRILVFGIYILFSPIFSMRPCALERDSVRLFGFNWFASFHQPHNNHFELVVEYFGQSTENWKKRK